MTSTKILLNSVVSTPDAQFMTLDIKDFYYVTALDRYEYIRMALADILQKIIDQYNLTSLDSNGWVYTEVGKCMLSLK